MKLIENYKWIEGILFSRTCIIVVDNYTTEGEYQSMATERQKEIKRRRNRRAKIKKYKIRLAQTNDPKEREYLISKLRRISIYTFEGLPEA